MLVKIVKIVLIDKSILTQKMVHANVMIEVII